MNEIKKRGSIFDLIAIGRPDLFERDYHIFGKALRERDEVFNTIICKHLYSNDTKECYQNINENDFKKFKKYLNDLLITDHEKRNNIILEYTVNKYS